MLEGGEQLLDEQYRLFVLVHKHTKAAKQNNRHTGMGSKDVKYQVGDPVFVSLLKTIGRQT